MLQLACPVLLPPPPPPSLTHTHTHTHTHLNLVCEKVFEKGCPQCSCRFQHAQLVEEAPHVRFYAGAPLISSEGYVMGSLGIMDLVPRK